MALSGWKKLLAGAPWFRGEGRFPLPAYSEFMPPPRVGTRPYGTGGTSPFDDDDPWAAVAPAVRARPAAPLVARARLLGLPCAVLGSCPMSPSRAT